jgi:hypothetical protein
VRIDQIPKDNVGLKFCNKIKDAGNIINCPRDAEVIAIPIEIPLFLGETDLLIAPNTRNVTPYILIAKIPDAIINSVFVEKNPIKNKPKAQRTLPINTTMPAPILSEILPAKGCQIPYIKF